MELTLHNILRDDYEKILSLILREYLKFDKNFESEKLGERLRYMDLLWIIRLSEHYRSIIDFSNPLEPERCGELVIKFAQLLSDKRWYGKGYNLFRSFCLINKESKRNYRCKKHFYVCDTLKAIIDRQPKDGTGK